MTPMEWLLLALVGTQVSWNARGNCISDRVLDMGWGDLLQWATGNGLTLAALIKAYLAATGL